MIGKNRISMIAAVSLNGVIGLDQQLPWNVPEDSKYFQEMTDGAPVVMGRKTLQSVGRPLPRRKNIVITRQSSWSIPGAFTVSTLEQALHIAQEGILPEQDIFVIGGGEIYRLALSVADRLYITEIDVELKGDAFFPFWPEMKTKAIRIENQIVRFKETHCRESSQKEPLRPLTYRFYTLDRA